MQTGRARVRRARVTRGAVRLALAAALFCVALWSPLGESGVRAAGGPAPEVWTVTLQEALQTAARRNPLLQAALARLAAEEAKADAARAEVRGRVEGEANAGRFYLPPSELLKMQGPPRDGEPAPTEGLTGNRYTGAVTWAGSLWASPQRAAADLGAEAGRAAARKEWQDTAARVVRSAAEAYLDLLRAQEGERVAQQRERWAAERLRVTRARYEQGQATPADVLEAEAEWQDAQMAVRQARQGRELAGRQLLLWLGEPLDRTVVAVDPLEEDDPVLQAVLRELPSPTSGEAGVRDRGAEEAVQAAQRRRWDVRALEAQVGAARANLASVEARNKPTLGLSATYQWPDAAATVELDRWGFGRVRVEGGRQELGGQLRSQRLEDQWQVGLQLKWTLWDGGLRVRRKDEAEAQLAAAEASLRQLLPGLELEVEAALQEVYRTQWAEEVAATRLEAAEEALRQVERLEAMSAATEADRLAALTRREAARLEWKTARWERVKAQLTFAVATGWLPEGFSLLPGASEAE